MHVLLHVSLEENCDLIKCISTIYEHWKIVNHGPHQQRSVAGYLNRLTFRLATLKKAPPSGWAATSYDCFTHTATNFRRTGQKTDMQSQRITVRGECELITNCECVCVCVFVCFCVFDHNDTVTQILIGKKRSHKSGAVILSFIALFIVFIAIWYELFALLKLLLKLN